MNKQAAFFASIFVAVVALLSSIYILINYGIEASIITIVAAIVWIFIGYYFKNSKSK